MTTQISTQNIQSTSLAVLEGPKITNIQITNSGGTVLDDTAVALAGGYIKLTGSGFQTGCQIKVAGALATSVTFISSTEVRAQVAAASAGTYDVYFTNSDGSTAIRISGLTYSATPTWVTASSLPNQAVDVAISVQLEATGATSYSLQSGSSLPSGVTLSSGGLISGTVTGIAEETTYNFTIEAIDAELQDSPRTFSVTITVGPPAGALYAWGKNNQGQLGLNDRVYKSSPVQVGAATTWTVLAGAENFSFGIKSDGTLWGWGYNGGFGQLGLNNTIFRSSPTQIGSATDWELVSAGNYHAIFKKTNGTIWTVGRNDVGQLGLGDFVYKSSPTQVGSATNWNQVQMGTLFSGATKTDGTLWMWGTGSYGRLGLNSLANRNSPTQVGTSTNWSNISLGRSNVLATKTDGTLWTWGNNNNGQLGLNNTIYRSSPVQLGSDTNWNSISVGYNMDLASKTNGTLWSWGSATSGQLGLNNAAVNRSSPTQVGSDSNWDIVSSGWFTSGAIKTTGTLWLWGNNTYGQLGLNSTGEIGSPQQVGASSTWVNLFAGRRVIAVKQ